MNAGYSTLQQLVGARLHGIGPNALGMAEQGLAFQQ